MSYFLVDNQTLIKNLKQKFKYLLNQWLKNIQNMPNILKCNMCNEKEIYITKIIGVTVYIYIWLIQAKLEISHKVLGFVSLRILKLLHSWKFNFKLKKLIISFLSSFSFPSFWGGGGGGLGWGGGSYLYPSRFNKLFALQINCY